MYRMATRIALCLWLGFFLTIAAGYVIPYSYMELGEALPATGSAASSDPVVWSVALVVAALFAAALAGLHRSSEPSRAAGENLAYAAVGVTAALVAASSLFGHPFDGIFSDIGRSAFAVAMTLAAMAFDHCMEVAEDDDQDDLAFRKTVASIDWSQSRARTSERQSDERAN